MPRIGWKIIIILDLLFAVFTVLYLLYNLIPLFYHFSGAFVDRELFNMGSANVFGILFVIMILKLFIGIIFFIILKIKYKKNLLENMNNFNIFIWLIFSVLILSYAIVLIIMKSYNSNYNLLYTILIIIGTFCWLRIISYKNIVNKILERLFVIGNIINNIILIIIGYIISIY